jgi:DnaJ like chaperone protein
MNGMILSSFSVDTENQIRQWFGILVMAFVIGLPIIYFGFRKKKTGSWEDGVFPPNFSFNRDNLMESYIAAAAVMIRKDPYQMAGKLTFINSYFQRNFKDVYYDFKDSYAHSLRHPVSIKSMAFWFNKHLRTNEEKMNLIWFLYDLCWYDGELNDQEYTALKTLTLALQQPWEPVQDHINERDKRNRKVEKTTVEPFDKRKSCLAVLGLEETADAELIKSTYRKLVKIYHPDKYQQLSEEEQKAASKKFVEIQLAYEYLSL